MRRYWSIPEGEAFSYPVGVVRRSNHRSNDLRVLTAPHTPSEIAQKLEMHQSTVSRALSELRKEGLVEVLNQDAKHGRLNTRTADGDDIVDRLQAT